MRAAWTLRVQMPGDFRPHWSVDEWATTQDADSSPTSLGIEFVDIGFAADGSGVVCFAFFRRHYDGWEGRDYAVEIRTA